MNARPARPVWGLAGESVIDKSIYPEIGGAAKNLKIAQLGGNDWQK
jgi:hypothetical protein